MLNMNILGDEDAAMEKKKKKIAENIEISFVV